MSERDLDDLPDAGEPWLDEAEEQRLAAALRAAYAPAELDPVRHAEILALALEDPFAEPSDDELRESERLRQALESDDVSHPDAALARALRAATSPEPLPRSEARRLAATVTPKKPNVVYVAFGGVALAAAAAFALFVARPSAKSSFEGAARSSPASPAAVGLDARSFPRALRAR